jgi:hypothetical protein
MKTVWPFNLRKCSALVWCGGMCRPNLITNGVTPSPLGKDSLIPAITCISHVVDCAWGLCVDELAYGFNWAWSIRWKAKFLFDYGFVFFRTEAFGPLFFLREMLKQYKEACAFKKNYILELVYANFWEHSFFPPMNWGLNSGSCTCQTSALPLSYIPSFWSIVWKKHFKLPAKFYMYF